MKEREIKIFDKERFDKELFKLNLVYEQIMVNPDHVSLESQKKINAFIREVNEMMRQANEFATMMGIELFLKYSLSLIRFQKTPIRYSEKDAAKALGKLINVS